MRALLHFMACGTLELSLSTFGFKLRCSYSQTGHALGNQLVELVGLGARINRLIFSTNPLLDSPPCIGPGAILFVVNTAFLDGGLSNMSRRVLALVYSRKRV